MFHDFGGHLGFSVTIKIAQRCQSGMLANINLDISSINNPQKKFVVSDLHGSTQICHLATRLR